VVDDVLAGADELDVEPEEPAEVEELFVDVPLALVAIAAAWKAAKLFSAVGFTANTIPFSQCPV